MRLHPIHSLRIRRHTLGYELNFVFYALSDRVEVFA